MFNFLRVVRVRTFQRKHEKAPALIFLYMIYLTLQEVIHTLYIYIYIHVTRIIYLQRQLLYTWLRYTSSISNFYNFPEQMAHPSKSIAFFESGPECRCAVHRCFRSATSRFTSAMGESLVERQWSLGLTGRSFVGEVR